MNTNKDMTIEELKEIATKAGLSFEETATKEDLLTLIENNKGSETIEEIKEVAPVEEVKEVAPVEEIKEVVPVEEVKEVAPVEEIKEVAPVEEVPVVEEAKEETPEDEEAKEETPEDEEVKEEVLIVEEVKEAAAVEEVKDEYAAVEETVVMATEGTLTEDEPIDESEFAITNDDSQKPKKKSKLFIIIPIIVFVFVLLITVLGIVIYMNTKSYKVEKHNPDESLEQYYELIDEFETYQDELLTSDNLGVDVTSTTLEERKSKYTESMDSVDDITESIQAVYDYILECERDFVITDDEIKELESMIDDLQ